MADVKSDPNNLSAEDNMVVYASHAHFEKNCPDPSEILKQFNASLEALPEQTTTARHHPSNKELASRHLNACTENAMATFECNCRIAAARGQKSCLKQFSIENLITFHHDTYGMAPVPKELWEVT
jgi:hypothetical protein